MARKQTLQVVTRGTQYAAPPSASSSSTAPWSHDSACKDKTYGENSDRSRVFPWVFHDMCQPEFPLKSRKNPLIKNIQLPLVGWCHMMSREFTQMNSQRVVNVAWQLAGSMNPHILYPIYFHIVLPSYHWSARDKNKKVCGCKLTWGMSKCPTRSWY